MSDSDRASAPAITEIAALSPWELEEWIQQHGHPRYRALQLLEALHGRGVRVPAEITVLPAALREQLQRETLHRPLRCAQVKRSTDGTRKYQFQTHDGHLIESVWIPNVSRPGRHALCISSQVGCAMGCRFCATAALKLKRHLSAGEITAQVHGVLGDLLCHSERLSCHSERSEESPHVSAPSLVTPAKAGVLPRCARQDDRKGDQNAGGAPASHTGAESLGKQRGTAPVTRWIDNIVYMGMGEPLHNVEQVIRSIQLLTHPRGLGLAPRRITVSTSGIVPAISQLLEQTQVHLAISLNATTDDVRSGIMPVNRKWNLATLMETCRNLPLGRRRRITFEYVLLAGVNDTPQDAQRLRQLLRGLPFCRVNLIPFNPHPLSPFKRPEPAHVLAFQQQVRGSGNLVFIRRTRGDDVDAACGMLHPQNKPRIRGIDEIVG
ncbi:MAG: 23S rRNA (adenine(2503)-C(2))-methyltransferase RlmN [Myxococcota bacterium]